MHKVKYPAFFNDGLIGVKVEEDIQHGEAFLAVPSKMFLSVDKARKNSITGPIIKSYPKVFEQNDFFE